MKKSSGFTLIEIIAIITIAAIAAALFISSLGVSFTQSPAIANLVGSQHKMIDQMETITGKYRQALPIDSLDAFRSSIIGLEFVDSARTYTYTYSMTDNLGNTVTQTFLLVTLTDGKQTLQGIYTQ